MQSDQSQHSQSRMDIAEQGKNATYKSIQANTSSTPHPETKKDSDRNTKLSLTEQEIHSHSIIKQILNKCRHKVVQHSLNPVSPKIQLYRKRNQSNLQVLLKIQDDQQEAKASDIYKQIMQELPIKLKIEKQASRLANISQNTKKDSVSLPSKRSAIISVSGVISYNFTSIKARNRLVYDTEYSQKQLTQALSSAKSKIEKAAQRSHNIRMRTDPTSATDEKQLNQAIAGGYCDMKTNDYLTALRQEKQNNKFIYGEKLKYLKYLTKSMKIQGNNQTEAQFTINQLKLACRPTPKHKPVIAYKRGGSLHKINQQQHSFEARKIPFKHKKPIITFTQND